ncbi:MAG: hypothetical protein KIH67_003120 [Candidatus Moranbacteria bacterium]|nr:hypothetical protein [Candidatus Moranbacteria bacterium]
MNFSATNIIGQAWEVWKKHIVFTWMILGIMLAVSIVFSIINPKGDSALISILSSLVSLFFELGAIALLLKLVRTDTEGDIKEIAGQKAIYVQALIATIVFALMLFVGFLLLIIPGVYVAVRFMLLPYVLVDQKLGWKESLKEASRLSEGNRLNLFGFILLLTLMNFVGALLLLVGLLVTAPVSYIAMTMAYEHLKKEKSGASEEVKVEEEKKEEVIDLPASTPEPAV